MKAPTSERPADKPTVELDPPNVVRGPLPDVLPDLIPRREERPAESLEPEPERKEVQSGNQSSTKSRRISAVTGAVASVENTPERPVQETAEQFYETWRKKVVYHRTGRMEFKPEEAFQFAEAYAFYRESFAVFRSVEPELSSREAQWADCPRCRQKVLAPHECYESVLDGGEREAFEKWAAQRGATGKEK
jgi:hypothetical protein